MELEGCSTCLASSIADQMLDNINFASCIVEAVARYASARKDQKIDEIKKAQNN